MKGSENFLGFPFFRVVIPNMANKLIDTVDSDLGGCVDSGKSTSGLVLMLNAGPILWRSSRQSTASTGTAEAECKAAGFIGQQLVPMIDLLSELGFEQSPVRVLENNIARGRKATPISISIFDFYGIKGL